MVLRSTQKGFARLRFARFFLQRVISRLVDLPWPPHSQDLTENDFFLCGSRPLDFNALK